MAINTTTDLNVVDTSQLVDESVTTDKLDGQAVTAAKIHTGAVTETKIADDAVTAAKIATGAVGATELASASVGTAKIDSGAATVNQFLSANGSGGASFASVEGTALNSTGATAGHVLTAGAGGTTTTWQPAADAGAFATASISFSFSGANDTTVKYTLGTAVNHGVGVGGAGTTLLTVAHAADATAHTYRTFSIPAHTANATVTAFATATIGNAPGGGTITGGVTYIPNNNQASSTSVYWLESSRRDGLYRSYFRKYDQTLTTNQWSVEVGIPNSGSWGQFKGLQYIPQINAWLTSYSNIYHSAGTNSVMVINDTSGSVYRANFIGNLSGGTEWYITDVAYVPPTGAGDGTVYAFGTSYSGNHQRIVTYTVGSASISANSTATSFAAKNIPSPAGTTIMSVYWDSEISKLVVVGTNGLSISTATRYSYYQFDRNFDAAASSTSVYAGTAIVAQQRFGNYAFGYKPENSGDSRAAGRVGYFGAAGTGYAPTEELLPTGSTALAFSSYYGDFAGVQIAPGGTLTAYLDSKAAAGTAGGTAESYPIARKRAATASIGTAATGRMIWGASTAAVVVSTTADQRITMDGALSYLPAGSIITQVATDATATGTVTNTFYTIGLK